MQWKNGAELTAYIAEQQYKVGEELSDILYWTLLIAHDLEINLANAFMAKLAANEAKYPADKARNSNKKYTDLQSED